MSAEDYYDEEIVNVTVRYLIKWNKNDRRARKDAIRLVNSGASNAGGCGLHGCYGAERVGVDALEEQDDA